MTKSLMRIFMFRHSGDVRIDDYDHMDMHSLLPITSTLVIATIYNRSAAAIIRLNAQCYRRQARNGLSADCRTTIHHPFGSGGVHAVFSAVFCNNA